MKTITVQELKERLGNNEVLLIDVREPAEYRAECIEGACLIPLREISLERMPTNKGAIVVHCRSGKRSADACQKLLEQDPTMEVYSLEGGIVAWQKAGFDVKKSGSIGLPLDQQTLLVAGFLVLFGTLLGTFLYPQFYVIPGIVGLGLTFGGLTGWCGMTKLLALMPWNR